MYVQKLTRFWVGRRTLLGRFAGAAGGRADGSSAGAGVGFVLGRPVLINQGATGGPQVRVLCRSAGKSLERAMKSAVSWNDTRRPSSRFKPTGPFPPVLRACCAPAARLLHACCTLAARLRHTSTGDLRVIYW